MISVPPTPRTAVRVPEYVRWRTSYDNSLPSLCLATRDVGGDQGERCVILPDRMLFSLMISPDPGVRKRSVAHLTKTQLKRKRAQDRVAQQNIRRTTKERITALENMVEKLKEGMSERLESMYGMMKKNAELEAEIDVLKAILAQHGLPHTQMPPFIAHNSGTNWEAHSWMEDYCGFSGE